MAKQKKYLARSSFLVTAILIAAILLFEAIFIDKFYPRVFLGDTHLMLLTKLDAGKILSGKYQDRASQKIELSANNQNFTIDLATTSANIDFQKSLDSAYNLGRNGNIFERLIQQLQALIFGANLTPDVSLEVNSQITPIEKVLFIAPKNASLTFNEQADASSSAKIQIEDGKEGLALDKEALQRQLKDFLIFGKKTKTLPLKIVPPEIKDRDVQLAKQFLEGLGEEPIKLTFENSSWLIDPKTLITLLDLKAQRDQIIDSNKLSNFIKDIGLKIDQPVVEAQFNFDEASRRVTIFKPAQEGRKLDQEKTASLILLALKRERSKTISLPVEKTEAKIKTDQVNNLGVKELLGRGISNFSGSIPNRIYNLSLAASRINGVLIPPGEVFSFNDRVGDISAASGYKQAYVIKDGRTALDDGGGVCQDSTTLFRAVLNAGLPVVARTAHAYRVGYYEQGFPPGLDATVFAPSVDFKFKNDTPAHVLIQAYTEGITLYVDLYGTDDGRISTISTPLISSQTPPPPELRQDDPTLPKGEIKQVDFPAWGASVSFTRTVKRGGETLIYETYRSNFKPWQAIYLVGTKEN